MVARETGEERRIKVSLSLEPAMVEYLDSYAATHPALNRSRVVEQAVSDFRRRQIERDIERQYDEPESEETQSELEGWRSIRRTAARRGLET